jgi:hypothetical protein
VAKHRPPAIDGSRGRLFCLDVRLEQRLPEDDVPAHMSGLLRQIRPAQLNRLLEIPEFPILVRERREVPARVLVELLTQLVNTGRTGH